VPAYAHRTGRTDTEPHTLRGHHHPRRQSATTATEEAAGSASDRIRLWHRGSRSCAPLGTASRIAQGSNEHHIQSLSAPLKWPETMCAPGSISPWPQQRHNLSSRSGRDDCVCIQVAWCAKLGHPIEGGLNTVAVCESADVRDPFLDLRLGCGSGLCRKLEHFCFLTFKHSVRSTICPSGNSNPSSCVRGSAWSICRKMAVV